MYSPLDARLETTVNASTRAEFRLTRNPEPSKTRLDLSNRKGQYRPSSTSLAREDMAVQKVDVRLAEKGLLWDYERNRPVQIVGGRVPKYAVAKSALLQIAKLGNKQVDSRKKRSKVNYSRSKMS